MSIFKNKILIKIVASLCVVLTIINMGVPTTIHAEEDDEYGGILLTPVTNLLVSVCDGIIGLLHDTIQYQDITLIQISGEPNWWNNWGKAATGILITTLVILIGGAVLGGSIIAAVGIIAKIKIGATAFVAVWATQKIVVEVLDVDGGILGTGTFLAEQLGNWFSGTLYMPIYTITPRYIFSNEIKLFDINFFNPMESEEVEVGTTTTTNDYDMVKAYYDTKENIEKDDVWIDGISGIASENKLMETSILSKDNLYKNQNIIGALRFIDVNKTYSLEELYDYLNNQEVRSSYLKDIITAVDESSDIIKIDSTKKNVSINWRLDQWGANEDESETYLYNTVKLDISDGEDESDKHLIILISNGAKTASVNEKKIIYSSAAQLKDVVGNWYFILRNFALLLLLLILIYVGIRIVIGSTAGQKAKYKERLKDWLVAVCLLFIMHYIMVFSVKLVEEITKLLNFAKVESGVMEYVPLNNEHIKALNDMKKEEDSPEYKALSEFGSIVENGSEKQLVWTTELMGKFRILTQAVGEGTVKWVGYAMCYMVLVIFTVFFTWTYLKRVLYMAFLTLIAPMVAMTYPLDKINDGKAQAFSMWLKEYIFNLLIQPMHLLLYTILVSSAYTLAATNALYAIVAIGFMVPAEQLVRKFFGFTKAQTAGALGGAAGAALAYTGLQNVMKFTKKVTGKQEKEKNSKDKDLKIKGEGINAREAVADSLTSQNSDIHVDASDSGRGTPIRRENEGAGNQNNGGNSPQQPPQNENQPEENHARENTRTPSSPENVSEGVQDNTPKEPAQTKATSNGKKKKEKIEGNFIRGVKGITGNYFRQLGSKMEKRVKKQQPIRALARGVGGIYGGAIMGIAGAALGVASGDASKVLKYGSAGALGGYTTGKAVAGKAVNTLSVDKGKLLEEIEESFYQSPEGRLYKEKKLEETIKKRSKNENNILELRKYLPELSRAEASELIGGEIGKKCYESGFGSMEDIATVYKAKESREYSVDEAIAGLKFNSYLPSKFKEMGSEEQEDMINRWQDEYKEMKESDPDKYKDLDPKKAAERSWELADKIGKIKSGLTDA